MFPNFPKARVTQVRFPVLTKQQIRVHSNLPGAQSQRADLVGQKKKSSLPWFSLASLSHIVSAGLPFVFSNCVLLSLFFVLSGSTFAWGYPFLFWVSKRPGLLPAFPATFL